MLMRLHFTYLFLMVLLIPACKESIRAQDRIYYLPGEEELHEGTWLQWPHHYEYGLSYRNRLDDTWIEITRALIISENVHIIAYNTAEKNRIISLLKETGVNLEKIDFCIFPTNDVWIRDNGPVFVVDVQGNMLIQDWGFNGWGGKYKSKKCDAVPAKIGEAINHFVLDLNAVMVNEGGAIEVDGRGVLLACKSSVISQSPANTVRNKGMTQSKAEEVFSKYLGVSKFIWLNGATGVNGDITDLHVDGFARFAKGNKIITMNPPDLKYWGLPDDDVLTLYAATDIEGSPYEFIHLPLTTENVVTAYGKNLGYKGSYVNYYVANTVVLVPNYKDKNDSVANKIIQAVYPDKTVLGIDVRNLYENGGMVHCVTMQQPLFDNKIGYEKERLKIKRIYPLPVREFAVIELYDPINNGELIVFDQVGKQLRKSPGISGKTISFLREDLPQGLFFLHIKEGNNLVATGKIVIRD
jgi:agmatine deiminase